MNVNVKNVLGLLLLFIGFLMLLTYLGNPEISATASMVSPILALILIIIGALALLGFLRLEPAST